MIISKDMASILTVSVIVLALMVIGIRNIPGDGRVASIIAPEPTLIFEGDSLAPDVNSGPADFPFDPSDFSEETPFPTPTETFELTPLPAATPPAAITEYCCAITAPVGGASTLSSGCLDTRQNYTYQIGTGGELGPVITETGQQACTRTPITFSTPFDTTTYIDPVQCNSACNAILSDVTCEGWPGYEVPVGAVYPGPNLKCTDIDTYGEHLKTRCDDSCAFECQLRTTGYSWSCVEPDKDKGDRDEGVWLCPLGKHDTCPSQPKSPCEHDPTYCVTEDSGFFRSIWNSFTTTISTTLSSLLGLIF